MTRKEAQLRNHNILRLKGMWHGAKTLCPHHWQVIRNCVNDELEHLGATTCEMDHSKRMREPRRAKS